jgi:hypothetical protein
MAQGAAELTKGAWHDNELVVGIGKQLNRDGKMAMSVGMQLDQCGKPYMCASSHSDNRKEY